MVHWFFGPVLSLSFCPAAALLVVLLLVELAEVAERDHERAQQEHERAEQERARADYHAAREKMLIARLRALGFNPDEVTADNFAESIDTSETQSIG